MIGWLPAFLNLFLWKFDFSSFGIFVTLCPLLHPASNYCGCVWANAHTLHGGTFVCLHVLFELLVRSLQSCSDSRKMTCGSRFSILRWWMRLFEVRVQIRKLLENYRCVSGCACVCVCFLSVILRYTVSLKMKSFWGNWFWLHVSLSACSLSAKGIHLLLIAVQIKPLILTVKYNQSSK